MVLPDYKTYAMQTNAFILTLLIVLTTSIGLAQSRNPGSGLDVNGNVHDMNVASQNPTHDSIMYTHLIQSFLTMKYKDKATGKILIQIYNSNSKPIISKYVQSDTQLDLRNLIAGTYLIKISNENGKELYSGKVIKQ